MGVVLSSRKPPKSAFPLTGLQHKYHPGRTVHCFQNIWFNKRTHPNEMGIGCQRNAYWPATNHLSSRGLCSQSRSCRLRQSCVPEGAVH